MTNYWDNFDNSDDTINTNHDVFQQGKNLYNVHVLIARIDKGENIPMEDVRKYLKEFCYLVNAVGQLRYAYYIAHDKIRKMRQQVLDLLEKM